jgi:hypothetical protein
VFDLPVFPPPGEEKPHATLMTAEPRHAKVALVPLHAPRLEWLAGSVADLLSHQSFRTCLSFYWVDGDGVSAMNGLGPTETCVTAQGGG